MGCGPDLPHSLDSAQCSCAQAALDCGAGERSVLPLKHVLHQAWPHHHLSSLLLFVQDPLENCWPRGLPMGQKGLSQEGPKGTKTPVWLRSSKPDPAVAENGATRRVTSPWTWVRVPPYLSPLLPCPLSHLSTQNSNRGWSSLTGK